MWYGTDPQDPTIRRLECQLTAVQLASNPKPSHVQVGANISTDLGENLQVKSNMQ